jgi:acetoin utilization protein AcuB
MNLSQPVTSIMTSNVSCLEPNQLLVEVKHLYESPKFHHHIPVVQNMQLVGMISLTDFMRAVHNAGLDDNEQVYQKVRVKDIMSLQPISLDASANISQVASILAKGDIHAVAITKDNKVIGMVSTKDLINYFLTLFD